MLEHETSREEQPARVVILGAAGFVGAATQVWLEERNCTILGVGRKEIDLLATDARERLAGILQAEDTLVIISAEAPCKDGAMLERNIRMMNAVTDVIQQRRLAHAVYVSSDAVYADSTTPITERSPAEPSSLHGVMHLAREIMLRQVGIERLAIVRPTLIYGKDDPHNGYGPNRFRRLALEGKTIQLFGQGEERRDHVSIRDVAELIGRIIMRKSAGLLNIATGRVLSFREIAEIALEIAGNKNPIKSLPRHGPIPHGGYRPFDPAETKRAFPDFEYTSFEAGFKETFH